MPTVDGIAYTVSNGTTISNQVWSNWVIGFDAGTSVSTTVVWRNWNLGTGSVYEVERVYAPPPPEEIAEQQRVWNERAAAQEREREEAATRARMILDEHLDERQRADLARNGWFELRTDRHVYRIRRGVAGNVDRIEGGRAVERFCIHPSVSVPTEDVMLAQKLLLETDEDSFRRIANVSRIAA